MVHLLLLRECKSYTYSQNAEYGTHEQIERNISKRKYKLNNIRDGYNIPFGTELKTMNYRVKKEVVHKFANDLDGLILNPYPNKTHFWGLFFGEKYRSVGRLFYIIQYFFKWMNRFPFKYINPLKPVNVLDEPKNSLSEGHWCYNYIFGYLEDPTETIYDYKNKEKYEQEDIL